MKPSKTAPKVIKNQLFKLSLLLSIFSIQTAFSQKLMICGAEETSLCTSDGKEYLVYEKASYNSSDSYTAFVEKNNLFGILDLDNGKEILACQYDKIYACNNQRYIVLLEKNKEWFFYDFKVKKQISPNFKSIEAFIDGKIAYLEPNEPFAAKVNGKCGSMTMFGKTIIPFEYDDIISSRTGYHQINMVQKGSDYFLVDSIGKRINSINYKDIIGRWDPNYIAAFDDKGIVFLDQKGMEFRTPEGSDVKVQKFLKKDTLVLLNVNGKIINKENYSFYDISEWRNYLFLNKEGKKGVIDFEGKEILPFIYDAIYYDSFAEEVIFHIKRNGKKGCADKHGKENWSATCLYK